MVFSKIPQSPMVHVMYLIIISMLLSSCRKEIRYPEDPKATSKTPAERLRGLWQLTNYTFEGESVMNRFGPRIDPRDLFISCVLEESVANVVVKGRTFPQVRCKLEPDFLVIGPHSRDTAFVKGFYSPFQYDSTRFNHLAFWKITKLYKTEFNIIFETDTGTFKMFFQSINP